MVITFIVRQDPWKVTMTLGSLRKTLLNRVIVARRKTIVNGVLSSIERFPLRTILSPWRRLSQKGGSIAILSAISVMFPLSVRYSS